jgi:hypothetical protein
MQRLFKLNENPFEQVIASYGKGSPLLLFDYQHLYLVLTGGSTFENVVRRVRRHASQEGKAFLAVADFGN